MYVYMIRAADFASKLTLNKIRGIHAANVTVSDKHKW